MENLTSLMEAKGFSFIPEEEQRGWLKNRFFVPFECLEDHPTPDFVEIMAYFADNDFQLGTNPESNRLLVSNDFVTLDFFECIKLSFEQFKKEISGIYEKEKHQLN